jgi:hypothetical protein
MANCKNAEELAIRHAQDRASALDDTRIAGRQQTTVVADLARGAMC